MDGVAVTADDSLLPNMLPEGFRLMRSFRVVVPCSMLFCPEVTKGFSASFLFSRFTPANMLVFSGWEVWSLAFSNIEFRFLAGFSVRFPKRPDFLGASSRIGSPGESGPLIKLASSLSFSELAFIAVEKRPPGALLTNKVDGSFLPAPSFGASELSLVMLPNRPLDFGA